MPSTSRAVRQRLTSRTSCRRIVPFSHSQGAPLASRWAAAVAASCSPAQRQRVTSCGPAVFGRGDPQPHRELGFTVKTEGAKPPFCFQALFFIPARGLMKATSRRPRGARPRHASERLTRRAVSHLASASHSRRRATRQRRSPPSQSAQFCGLPQLFPTKTRSHLNLVAVSVSIRFLEALDKTLRWAALVSPSAIGESRVTSTSRSRSATTTSKFFTIKRLTR